MMRELASKAGAFHGELGVQSMIDLLAAAAHAFRRHRALLTPRSGLATDTLLHLLEAYRSTNQMSSDEQFRIMLILQQIVVTPHGTGHDADPAGELLADFLAARHTAHLLRQDPGAVVDAIGDPHVAVSPAFEQCLAQEFHNDPALARAVISSAGETSGGSVANLIHRLAATALAPALAASARAHGKSFFDGLTGRF